MNRVIVIVLCIMIAPFALANEAKKDSKIVSYPETSDVRCEKITGHSLVEFKTKLVENCDLNKPFSSSLSRVLNDDTYFYCCQLRK